MVERDAGDSHRAGSDSLLGAFWYVFSQDCESLFPAGEGQRYARHMHNLVVK